MAFLYGTFGSTNDAIWHPWQTTSSATTNLIWPQWAQTHTQSTIIASNVYNTWVTQFYNSQAGLQQIAQQQFTPQQLAAQRAAQTEHDRITAEHRAKWEAERALREKAEARALELLIENLSLQQRLDLKERGHFFVNGRSGCRYRIRRGQAGNIDIIDARGIITHRACVHPSIYVPDPDAMLGQKLRLEHDDVELIRIANRSPVGAEAPVLPALQ